MTLRVEHLSAGFVGHRAVTGVSFTVEPGEIVTVLGASGSGKTTLLRAIAGLHRCEAGRVFLGDRDVTGLPAERRRVGLVPQEGALFPHRTVAANIGYGVRRSARSGRVAEMLDLIGLTHRAESMPHELSGGQRQRVALARALAPAPPVLLLDEPFSSLDAALRVSLRMDFSRVVTETGTAAVLVTHDVTEALTMSDRIVVLDHGRVLAVGTPDDLYRRPPSQAVAERLGPATVLDAQPAGEGRVLTSLGVLDTLDATTPSGPGHAVVRPEQMRLWRAVDDTSAGHGRIMWSEYRGDTRMVHVALDEGSRLIVRAQPAMAWSVGDEVRVEVLDAVHVLP